MGPDQIHNMLDYVIQPGGRFSPQLVGVMMRAGTRQLWIRDCSKKPACPAHGIAKSFVRDLGQSASAT
jgi:hypothetical protein